MSSLLLLFCFIPIACVRCFRGGTADTCGVKASFIDPQTDLTGRRTESVSHGIIPVIVWPCSGWCHCFLDRSMARLTSAANHPSSLSLSLFPWRSPLNWLRLFSFFHCSNASCQNECVWVTALSFLDYRGLKGLLFSPHPPPLLLPPFFILPSFFPLLR